MPIVERQGLLRVRAAAGTMGIVVLPGTKKKDNEDVDERGIHWLL